MIKFKQSGNFDNIEKFLSKAKGKNWKSILERFGSEGVSALAAATPKDSGVTANSWNYEIVDRGRLGISIYWTNSNLNEGIPIVILLQYGHGTKSGTFVEGRDFINPAMRPIFDRIAENILKEVSDP